MFMRIKSTTAAFLLLISLTLSVVTHSVSNDTNISVRSSDKNKTHYDQKNETDRIYLQNIEPIINSTLKESKLNARGTNESSVDKFKIAGDSLESKKITSSRDVNESVDYKAKPLVDKTTENGKLIESKVATNNKIIKNLEEKGDAPALQQIGKMKTMTDATQASNVESNKATIVGDLEENLERKADSAKNEDKDGALKRDMAGRKEEQDFDEITTFSNKPMSLPNPENKKITSKEIQKFDTDKELTIRTIPIFPPLPIMFRFFAPLSIPPVQPVPPPALHISDRLPIFDADDSEASSESSTAEADSSQQDRKVMERLISDVLGSMLGYESPRRVLDMPEGAEKSSDLINAENGEESKKVDLQGLKFLLKSKVSELTGKHGRFILRFMSLRPLEKGVNSVNNGSQTINEKHSLKNEKATIDETQKKNIDPKTEAVSNASRIISPHETEEKYEDRKSTEETNIELRRKRIENDSTIMPMVDANSDSTHNLKQTAESIVGPHAEESQLKVIQYYRSFLNPMLPINKEDSSKIESSEEFRLKEAPLEGDVSVAPFIGKVSPSNVNVEEVSPSSAIVEKVKPLNAGVEKLKLSIISDEKVEPSAANVEKISSSNTSVEKLPLLARSIVNAEKIPSISNVENVQQPKNKVEKVQRSVDNVKIVSAIPPKCDKQTYEEAPKPELLETPRSLSKEGNGTVGNTVQTIGANVIVTAGLV